MKTVVNDAPQDPAFSVIPATESAIFANARVTPAQLASAARVREHAIGCEARAFCELESLPAIEKAAREDPNLRVREAAQRAARATRGKTSSVLERRARDLVG